MSDQFATCLIHNDKEGEFHTCPVCLEVELSTLRTQLKSVEADAAVMRSALQLAKEVTSNGFLPNPHTKRFDMTHFDVHATIDKALATNAGKAYQARMEEAEWLIEQIEVCNSSSWLKRRDAFLNPKPQDVK